MTKHNIKSNINIREKGQSLVEVALFLPVFLIIIAGLVEVSNILVTQNNVHNAARVGARFGANGGQNEGIALAALNSITESLNTSDDYWDIWSIRGEISEDGTSFDSWEFQHVYGISQTQAFSEVAESEIQAAVLEQLQTDENGNRSSSIAGDIDFVGTYVIYDQESLLGLRALQNLAGLNSLESLNVMRDTGTEDIVTEACDAFPIAVYENIRSLTPATWRTDLDYPEIPPAYDSFVNNVPDKSLLDAREGYIYNIQNGNPTGGMGWLAWNECGSSAVTLNDGLTWPGNSSDYTESGGRCPGYDFNRFPGFMEYGNPEDRSMGVGDWVTSATGSVVSNAVRDTIEEHIELGRTLRLIIYKDYSEAGGANGRYLISRFAIFRLIGYSLDQGGGESFILAEFVRWDDSCGQELD